MLFELKLAISTYTLSRFWTNRLKLKTHEIHLIIENVTIIYTTLP